MYINSNTIIAIATVALAVIAIYAIIAENKRSRFALGINVALELDEYFDSESMKRV
jgi:hypothetical protein